MAGLHDWTKKCISVSDILSKSLPKAMVDLIHMVLILKISLLRI